MMPLLMLQRRKRAPATSLVLQLLLILVAAPHHLFQLSASAAAAAQTCWITQQRQQHQQPSIARNAMISPTRFHQGTATKHQQRTAAVAMIRWQLSRMYMLPVSDGDTAAAVVDTVTVFATTEETWRQYVPLGVSIAVIVDILLGSPVANAALSVARKDEQQNEESSSDRGKQQRTATATTTKERIDSKQVAQDAVNRARNTLELRNFLDSNKSDWDRMEEMKRKMDEQAAVLERNSMSLQAKLVQQLDETKERKPNPSSSSSSSSTARTSDDE